MSVSTAQQHPRLEAERGKSTAARPWWDGLWFEGPMDPRGTGFAVALALAATVALVVVVAAAVRIATGA
jgi:hypothetical protein